MGYDLWDISTGNLVHYDRTEDEALAFVRDAIAASGRRSVSHWALQHVDAHGNTHVAAQGAALAMRAAKAIPTRTAD